MCLSSGKMSVPSLLDICVQKAIDNVRYIGDVGEIDEDLLQRIISHCTMEQLAHIENSSQDRDLSPITDKFWLNFYKSHFGIDHTNQAIQTMERNKRISNWKRLYEMKVKEIEEKQERSFEKVRERYKEEDARKQSRQVKVCTKVPPSSRKKNFNGGGPGVNFSNTKSNIMKKAKLDFLKSPEMKNLAAMKKNCIQRSTSVCMGSGKGFASTSSASKPYKKRY